jgi:hypothetical protein
MAKKNSSWKSASLTPGEILLDVQNPRIEVETNATQDEIRLKLLDYEDVLELAREIEKTQGLFYGERIITFIEKGQHIVLEGNRRIAASQMLLNAALVPNSYRLRFPKASTETLEALKKVLADVAPDRETAEPILTKRHTEQGVKPWSPVAKMRRAVRLLDHYTLPEVATVLGTTPSQVKRLVRPYRLLKYAIDMKGWTNDERKVLEDEKLKTNPYTRLFTLKLTKDALQLSFDEEENVSSTLPAKVFKDQMKRVVRDFLIPDPETKKTRCDTRTNPAEYFKELLNDDTSLDQNTPVNSTTRNQEPKKPQSGAEPAESPESAQQKPPHQSQGGTSRPKTPKASTFFENLECHIQDDKLIRLSNEIRLINHEKMTIAASMLTRALFESTLVYKLQQAKRWAELVKQEGRDPGLAAIIKFCGNSKNSVFTEVNICKILQSHTTTQAKNYLDAITHMKYQEADSMTLRSVANNLRQIIQYILSGN